MATPLRSEANKVSCSTIPLKHLRYLRNTSDVSAIGWQPSGHLMSAGQTDGKLVLSDVRVRQAAVSLVEPEALLNGRRAEHRSALV